TYHVVRPAGGQDSAIGREGRRAGAPLHGDDAEGLAGGRFPPANRRGIPRGEEASPGREGDRRLFTRQAVRPSAFLPRGRVQDVDSLGGGGGELFAVGGEGQAADSRFRAADPALLLACHGVPEEDGWVPAGRGDHLAVRRPGQRLEGDAVAEAD